MIGSATDSPNSFQWPEWLTWKNVQKVAEVALKVLVLGLLCYWNPPVFLVGFAVGFIAQLVNKSGCEKMVKKVLAAIGKRPWLFTGIAIAATAVCPAWLWVGPPLIGGFYGGYKVAKWFQDR